MHNPSKKFIIIAPKPQNKHDLHGDGAEGIYVIFYSCALSAYTRQWIRDGMKEDGQHILRRLPDTFEMTIDTLIRQCEDNTYENK